MPSVMSSMCARHSGDNCLKVTVKSSSVPRVRWYQRRYNPAKLSSGETQVVSSGVVTGACALHVSRCEMWPGASSQADLVTCAGGVVWSGHQEQIFYNTIEWLWNEKCLGILSRKYLTFSNYFFSCSNHLLSSRIFGKLFTPEDRGEHPDTWCDGSCCVGAVTLYFEFFNEHSFLHVGAREQLYDNKDRALLFASSLVCWYHENMTF